jgi:hypothetical protein
MDFTTLKYFVIKYNGNGLNADLLKNLWRKIVVKVHPDKGGSHAMYLEAQTEYETLLQYVNAGFSAKSDSPEAYTDFMTFLSNITPMVRDCVRAVMAIDGIRSVEVVGFWVNVAINKTDVEERQALKAISVDGKRFMWNKWDKVWVWKGKPAMSRRRYTKEEKRDLWGSEVYCKDKAIAG